MAGHPIFAALYDRMTGSCERQLAGPIRQELIGPLEGPEVLEVGAGTGANLPYYRRDVQLTAVEPDPHMLRRGKERARQLGREVRWVQAPAERLPFPDAGFDAVVTALVLCSVQDVEKALAELWRVLRPGGELRFLEHVAVEGFGRRMQRMINPLWSRISAGCRLDRDTAAALRRAGFQIEKLETRRIAPPTGKLIYGVARRPVG